MSADTIKPVDLSEVDEAQFLRRFVGCIVVSHDDKIVLQQRDSSGCRFPDHLATFGGGVDEGETFIRALVRELHEELGARVKPDDAISLGAFTEACTGYAELIHGYFWHDRHNTITGCYEGEARYYASCADALTHPKITDDLRWLLGECGKRGLVKS